jgi:hypothetical protein
MKIVVVGGSGLIGSKLVEKLRGVGHDPFAASPDSGVDTLTGQGLAEALEEAEVVVDVSNAPEWSDATVLEFFQTSTRNILAGEAAAAVGHHVALSVVGTDRLPGCGYFRAKLARQVHHFPGLGFQPFDGSEQRLQAAGMAARAQHEVAVWVGAQVDLAGQDVVRDRQPIAYGQAGLLGVRRRERLHAAKVQRSGKSLSRAGINARSSEPTRMLTGAFENLQRAAHQTLTGPATRRPAVQSVRRRAATSSLRDEATAARGLRRLSRPPSEGAS